ncbi:MAG TPA: hypothetical protein VN982_11070 [Candidatus Dormibacteraeota bacterium]|nr:hypothetical protein [Candidatus Dormibacteraeota bacterium]
MKTKLFIITLATLSLAVVPQARAQGGIVGWVAVAGACSVDSSSAAHRTSFGTVSFATGASGFIFLTCPVDGITRINPSDVNAFGLIFNNDNGHIPGIRVDHCTISASFVERRNSTGVSTVTGSFSTAGTSYSGFTTVDPIAIHAPLNFDKNTYVVNITLHRFKGVSCNPAAWATFAEDIIF